jgi:hypothetical protein
VRCVPTHPGFLRLAFAGIFSLLLLCFLGVSCPSGAWAQLSLERRVPYTYTIVQESTQSFANDTRQIVHSHADVDYTWAEHGTARTLYLDRTFIKSSIGGKIAMHAEMSREAMTMFPDGHPKTISAATGPPELKAMLEATFGQPLYRVDPAAKPTILATGEAKEMLTEGIIGQVSLFHPTIPPDRAEWETDAAMEFGTEGVVRGKLHYQRVPDNYQKPGLHRVRGTLTNPQYAAPDGKVVMKNVRCAVTGEQTFDAAARVWTQGKLSVNMTYDLAFPNGAKLGTATGSQVVTFKKR